MDIHDCSLKYSGYIVREKSERRRATTKEGVEL